MAKQLLSEKAWQEFRVTGLLWWINRILHVFGWAIVVEIDDSDVAINAYPARMAFRGFDEKTEGEEFGKLHGYLKDNASTLEWEAREGELVPGPRPVIEE